MARKVYYVDIPVLDDAMKCVGEFDSMDEALVFIREHIGDCDEQGKIGLITEMEEEAED